MSFGLIEIIYSQARYKIIHVRRKINWIFITFCRLVVTLLFSCLNKPCTVFQIKIEHIISLWWYDAKFWILNRDATFLFWKILFLYVFWMIISWCKCYLEFIFFFFFFNIMDCCLTLIQYSGIFLLSFSSFQFPTWL